MEPGRGNLGVDRPEPPAAADSGAHDERDGALLVGQVPVLGGLIHQAVHREGEEISEHDLDHRAHPVTALPKAAVDSASSRSPCRRRVRARVAPQPGVTWKTPPAIATSSPKKITRSSRASSSSRASRSAAAELELRHAKNNNPPCQAVLNVSTIARWRSRHRSGRSGGRPGPHSRRTSGRRLRAPPRAARAQPA